VNCFGYLEAIYMPINPFLKTCPQACDTGLNKEKCCSSIEKKLWFFYHASDKICQIFSFFCQHWLKSQACFMFLHRQLDQNIGFCHNQSERPNQANIAKQGKSASKPANRGLNQQ
jgi:hypothetical protein